MEENIKLWHWHNGTLTDEHMVSLVNPVYEVIRLIGGIPLFFESHMRRLNRSLSLKGIRMDVEDETVYHAIQSVMNANDRINHNIRIEIATSENSQEVIIFLSPTHYPEKSLYEVGVITHTAEITRHMPHAKVAYQTYLEKVKQAKIEKKGFEIILMDASGKLYEGSRSNLFFVKEKNIYSAQSQDILMGITREKIADIIEKKGYVLIEKDVYLSEIGIYDGCFLSGTSLGVLPIKKIDEVSFHSNENHVIIELENAFKTAVNEDIKSTRRQYKNDECTR